MMMYCDRCQVLSKDGETCPLCGSRRLRPAAASDPVLLLTTGQDEADRIAAAFEDSGIPHMKRMQEGGSASQVLLGQNRFAQIRIFVPLGQIEAARDVMRGIGALKDDTEGTAQLPIGEEQYEEDNGDKQGSLSPGRRAVLRIFSVVSFLILVGAVVFAADSIISAFKSMFH